MSTEILFSCGEGARGGGKGILPALYLRYTRQTLRPPLRPTKVYLQNWDAPSQLVDLSRNGATIYR